MKFLKSTLLTGLYILLPVLLLWIGLKEIGGVIAAMADPIADMFPSDFFDDVAWPGLEAAILIVLVSLLLGLMAKVPFVAGAGRSFETSVLNRIPMYYMLKMISSSLIKSDATVVKPAIIKDDAGGGEPCYVMEETDKGLATVLVPWSPASFAGGIRVVPKSRLEYFGCTFDEYSRSIANLGIGIGECMNIPPQAQADAPTDK